MKLLCKSDFKIGKYCVFSDMVLLFSFVLVGGFNDYASCLISSALLIHLIVRIFKNRELHIKLNLTALAVAVMTVFYGIVCFWAIDLGMAFVGFLKFLPILIYSVCLWQSGGKERLLKILPYFAAVLVIVSSIGSLIPPVKDLFLVSERLSGFFQYPNTFALFLLVSELLLLEKTRFKIIDYITLAVLVGGLLYTGSRTVFLLFLAANFVMVLLGASKKIKFSILLIGLVAVLLVVMLAVFGQEGNVLSRYLKIGFSQSTFVGRLLYVADALPLLLKYPFGMGYLGYHFVQGSIQTGVYNVSFVHNDFLQIALDIGIVPAILFLFAVICFFFKKNVPLKRKVIVATMALHSLFDFNLQFIGMFMLFILLINDNDGKELVIKNLTPFKFILPIIFLVNLYMLVALALSQFTAYDTADMLYPYNTRNKLLLLEQQEDIESANKIADEILLQNTHYYAPYSIKAKYAYNNGNFGELIENKNAVFLRNPFRYTEYREYCVMLINGISVYEKMGDTNSAQVCKKELISTKEKLESNNQKLSRLGSKINEQPVTKLSNDILDYIERITAENG